MNKEEILHAINIIITNEISLLRQNKKTWKLKKGKLDFPNLNSLLLVFSSLNDDKIKNEITLNIKNKIVSSNEETYSPNGKLLSYNSNLTDFEIYYVSEIPLLFICLCYLKNNEFAINTLKDISGLKTNNLVWTFLIFLLDSKLYNFNITETNDLLEISSGYSTGFNKLLKDEFLRKASLYGTYLINENIKTVNIEINQDKLLLIEKIKRNKLNPSFSNFLESIDDILIDKDEFSLSGMISNFRNFWEKIIIEIAEKLSDNINISIGKSESSKISNCRLFLKKQLELSDKDNSLITKFVDILHSEGGHSFTSSKEYFRLTKNIGIEILFLIITKFEHKINGV